MKFPTIFPLILSLICSSTISALTTEEEKTSLTELCKTYPKTVSCESYTLYCSGIEKSSLPLCNSTPLLLASLCNDSLVTDTTKCTEEVKSMTKNDILDTKQVSDQVYSSCFEMPNMKDCQGCGKPDNTTKVIGDCDLMRTYGGLCNDMPEMSQCGLWITNCADSQVLAGTQYCDTSNAAPNSNSNSGAVPSFSATLILAALLSFWGLFNRKIAIIQLLLVLLILTPFAASQSCVTPNATLSACVDFKLTNATVYLTDLCKQMPFMVGCGIHYKCVKENNDKGTCDAFSVLGDICLTDMPNMSGCLAYTSLCSVDLNAKSGVSTPPDPLAVLKKSPVKQCFESPPISSLPSTDIVNSQIKSICTEMNMDGCDRCTSTSSTYLSNCDLLDTYSYLCTSMPEMSQCVEYKSMCSANPTLSYCTSSGSFNAGINMRMYFHTGIKDYVLFFGWVPQNDLQYGFTLLAVFIIAIAFEGFLFWQQWLEIKWLKNDPDDCIYPSNLWDTEKTVVKGDLSVKASRRGPQIVMFRMLFKMVQVTLGYSLMLIAMTFNVGIFFAIVAGFSAGAAFFGGWISKMHIRSGVAEDPVSSGLRYCC